jgi:hypothetical protein
MAKVYFPADRSPAEWRALATQGRKRSAESFERCDTDGFRSQWANDVMARLYDFLAEVAEAGNVRTFRALADLDGNLLNAREVQTPYGYAWAITNADGSTSWFNESQAKSGARRVAAHAKKGYKFVDYTSEAVVMLSDGMMPHPYAVPRRDAVKTVTGDSVEEDY